MTTIRTTKRIALHALADTHISGLPVVPLIGAVVWLAAVAWIRPSPFERDWAMLILLLAAFVYVPLGIDLRTLHLATGPCSPLWRVARFLTVPAALLLSLAIAQPQGVFAALFALPWLAVCGTIALAGFDQLRRSHGPRRFDRAALDIGPILLAVGGGWTVLDRAGVRPLDFEPVIVLLTAIHFHYAGFVLPLVAALALERRPQRIARVAVAAIAAGVLLVAVGITATQQGFTPAIETAAALELAAAGLTVAWLHARLAMIGSAAPRAARALWFLSAAALAFSMLLAAAYGCRPYLPVAWLDIPWMRALHGTANAVLFAAPALVGWGLQPNRAVTGTAS